MSTSTANKPYQMVVAQWCYKWDGMGWIGSHTWYSTAMSPSMRTINFMLIRVWISYKICFCSRTNIVDLCCSKCTLRCANELQNVTDLTDILILGPRLLVMNIILMDGTKRNTDIVKTKLLYDRIKLRLLLETETCSIEKVAIETWAAIKLL